MRTRWRVGSSLVPTAGTSRRRLQVACVLGCHAFLHGYRTKDCVFDPWCWDPAESKSCKYLRGGAYLDDIVLMTPNSMLDILRKRECKLQVNAELQERPRSSQVGSATTQSTSSPLQLARSLPCVHLPVDQAPPYSLLASAVLSGSNVPVRLYWTCLLTFPTRFTCMRVMHDIAALPDDVRLTTPLD